MSGSSQSDLLLQRRFGPFFATQFLGAANDNLFKYAFTLLVTYHADRFSGLSGAEAVNVIAAVFILPFLLFSATSGQLADKYDKATLMKGVKAVEVGIMVTGAVGFYLHDFSILLGCIFLLGMHSTVFGPVKYAWLPAVLDRDEIVGGNGLVEMGTFVAILVGTIVAGLVIESGPDGESRIAVLCVALAVSGLATSLAIPRSKPADPALRIDWNPIRMTWNNIREAQRDRSVFLSLLGISWLWFFGSVFLTHFPQFAREDLGGDPAVATLLLAVFSIGIGFGSLLCERMSRRQLEIGLVPFGAIGMTVFTVDLWSASRGLPIGADQSVMQFLGHAAHWRVLVDLALLSMSAGFYSVPLYTLIQTRSGPSHRARIISANNILNALLMILAAAFAVVALGPLGLGIPELMLLTGMLNAVVAAHIFGLVPEFLLRFLSWLLVSVAYRLQKQGTGHLPAHGGALIVANHVSFVDALVLMAASPRPIRFVMDAGIFRIPVISWLFRRAKAIPIASARDDPEMLESAFERVSAELREGHLVCIFPEGRLTTDGELSRFRPGVMRILERDPVPVIPVALQGLWGSFFSRRSGAAMTRPFRRGFFSRIGISAGAPLAARDVSSEELQRRVQGLRGDWR